MAPGRPVDSGSQPLVQHNGVHGGLFHRSYSALGGLASLAGFLRAVRHGHGEPSVSDHKRTGQPRRLAADFATGSTRLL
jgi:hypothetical protein